MSSRFAKLLKAAGVTVTWYQRSVGARDEATGDSAITYDAGTEIVAVVRELSTDEIELGGLMAENKTLVVYVTQSISHMDKIAYQGEEYDVQLPRNFNWKGSFVYRRAECIKRQV